MKSIILGAFTCLSFITHSQNLVSASEITTYSVSTIQSMMNILGVDLSGLAMSPVKSYKIVYNTVDVHNNPTIASGAVYIPQMPCDSFPILAFHHGTEFDRNNVPSNNSWVSQRVGNLFAGNGFVSVLPDFLGMGENPGIHPYMHWESEATSTIDLIRATREFMENDLNIGDNGEVFLSGYSQGGHCAMAVHKYVTVNNLQSEFNITASAPLSAPLDLGKTQYELIFNEDSTFYMAEFVPYITASYELVYSDLYNGLEDYYLEPYDSIINEYLTDGTYSGGDWNALIPKNLYDFIQDSMLNNVNNNENHPFRIALRDNDLHNWVASEPIRLLHCGMDSMVSPLSSTIAMDTMMALGSTDVLAIDLNPNGTHETCVIPTIMYAFNWFDSLATTCEPPLSVKELYTESYIFFFPNPTNDVVTCQLETIGQLELLTMNGELISKVNGNSIDVSDFDSGFYLIRAEDEITGKIYFGKIRKL